MIEKLLRPSSASRLIRWLLPTEFLLITKIYAPNWNSQVLMELMKGIKIDERKRGDSKMTGKI